MKIDFLFVYGKLREFYTQEETFDIESLATIPVYTTGILYDLKGEAVLIDDDGSKVYGNLVSSTDLDILLRHTDAFMEYDEHDFSKNKYVRVVKKVIIESLDTTIKVWCYVVPTSRKDDIEKKAKLVANGDWLEYIKEKKMKELKKTEEILITDKSDDNVKK